MQEVYTGSDCALEYWVAYCGKGNPREGIRTALHGHANIYLWFSDPTGEVSQREEALANVPESKVVPGDDGEELIKCLGRSKCTTSVQNTHKKM